MDLGFRLVLVVVTGWEDVIPSNGYLTAAEITLVYTGPWRGRSWRQYRVERWTLDLPNALCVLVEGHGSYPSDSKRESLALE